MKNYRETAQESGPGKVGSFGGELSCFPRSIAGAFINSKSYISSSPLVVT